MSAAQQKTSWQVRDQHGGLFGQSWRLQGNHTQQLLHKTVPIAMQDAACTGTAWIG
jgi:hypothetical protein